MMRLHGTFNGTLVVAGLAIIFTLLAPSIFEFFTIITLTQVIGLSILALSLALVWGFGGILCFGQSAFFGIGAYAYSVAAVNIGGSTGAIFVAIIAAAIFAAVLGYFVFYGKGSDVCLAVITLTVSLILYSLMRRTSGPEYKIGNALLGGFNGTGSPPLNIPGNGSAMLFPMQTFYVSMAILIISYVFTGWLITTKFGRVCVSIRENDVRTELLGYDTRLYKLGLFSISAGIAGLGGVFFCVGVTRVTPDVFSLGQSALAIIWVIVGGRMTLIGPILATFVLYFLTSSLGSQQVLNANLVLGIILVIFVLLVPNGVVPTIAGLFERQRTNRISRQRERRMKLRKHRATR